MLAVFSYLWFMIGPVEQLLNLQYAFYAADGAVTRINQLLARSDEPQYPGGVNPFLGRQTVGIEVRDLSFSYGDEKVLDHLNLTIAPGEKVAIVGTSGGGKSTLVQLLLGLYTPQSGSIHFADASQPEIGLQTIREHVAVVLQHPSLFNDTVRANLTMGRERTDRPARWHHSRAAPRAGQYCGAFRCAIVGWSAPASGNCADGAGRTQGSDPGRGD